MTSHPWTPSETPWRSWDTSGPPGLYWRGDWTPRTVYEAGCVVYCNGEVWVAVENNVGNQPGTSDNWNPLASLTGGLNVQGAANTLSDLPEQGRLGQAWIVTGHLYTWTDDAWFDAGPITGPKGDQGPQGIPGKPGPRGFGIPTDGQPGDTLIRTTNDRTEWRSLTSTWLDLPLNPGWHAYQGPPDQWGNYYRAPAYTLTATGLVRLRGVAEHAPSQALLVVATVPNPPGDAEAFIVASNTGPTTLTVEPDGKLSVQGVEWVSLSGVAYQC